jgi:L-iditol 2-dehydrogenase
MKAAVLHGIGDLRIERRPVPRPAAGEALIRVRAVGVCGSEIHYYREGRIGDAVVRQPVIPGHEFSGEVAAVGAGVEGLHVGQRVAVEPGAPCRQCESCIEGNYHVCRRMTFCGTPPHDGAYREYISWPAQLCHPLPGRVSFAAGAMIEPAAVGFQAVKVAPVRLGDTVLVIGCGSIGLVTIQAALLSGASRVFATDVLDYRLKVARRLGADVTLNPRRVDVVARAHELTGGRGVDVAYEAFGGAETFQQAIDAVRPGGAAGLIGIASEDRLPLVLHSARRREVRILMVRRFVHEYPRVIAMLEARKLDLDYLVTHRFPLDRVEEAFRLVQDYRDGVLKALVTL